MVVIIHTLQGDEKTAVMQLWYGNILYFVQEALCRSAVPVFFIISGYLFFQNIRVLTFETLEKKIKSRIRTLVIPYLLWNLIRLTETLLKHLPCLSGLFPNIHTQHIDLAFLLGAFWVTPDGTCPILYPFWYVRDLIVLVAVSPVVFFAVKYLKIMFPILLAAGMFANITLLPGLSFSSAFFFSLGCWWAQYKKDKAPGKYVSVLCLTCWLPVAVIDTMTRTACWHTLSVVCGAGAICALGWIAKDIFRCTPSKKLLPTVFWVYAIHAILLGYVNKLVFMPISSPNEFLCLALHFIVFIITMSLSIMSYIIIIKYTPQICNILTGGRN